MPELPEVETIVRQLAPAVEGSKLHSLTVLDPRWCEPLAPAELAAAVAGRSVEQLARRGKYIVWELTGDIYLLLHLRMTGTLLWQPEGLPPYARAILDFGGRRLAFVDPRRFGTAELVLGTPALERFLAARLGIEPLGPDFTAEALRRMTRGRRAPVKPFLLDQRHVAGVGNIYADEALFRARIHPLRAAGALSRRQCEELHAGVIAALGAGIDARGASIDDFRDLDGARGSFQDRFLVHRRAGEPCGVCGAQIVKLVVGGRGTYVCPRCQPAPRRRRS